MGKLAAHLWSSLPPPHIFPITNAKDDSMHHVIPRSTFVRTKVLASYRSYGQKFAWRAHRGPLQPKDQPTVTSEDGTKTLRIRQQNNGEGSSLPLPPLMDPIAITAKQKHREPKAQRAKYTELSDSRKALAVNPFAQALATPIRNCNFTRARLPAHFLQPFVAKYRVQNGRVKGYIGADAPSLGYSEPSIEEHGTEGYSAGSARAKSYAFASRELTQVLGKKRKGKWNWELLVTNRLQEGFETRMRALDTPKSGRVKVKYEWTWTGSDEQIRAGLIDDVVKAFERYRKRYPDCEHIVPLSTFEQVAFCLTERPSGERLWTMDGETGIGHHKLPTLEEDVRVPAYDFSKLGLENKPSKLPLKDSPFMAILLNPRTLGLHMALQKLAVFGGDNMSRQWLIVRREDWEELELTGHVVEPPILRRGEEEDGYVDDLVMADPMLLM